jgi:hypothetical protein
MPTVFTVKARVVVQNTTRAGDHSLIVPNLPHHEHAVGAMAQA